MDRINQLRNAIKRSISAWADFYQPEPEIESILIFDEKTDNYVWIHTGWEGKKHINHTVIHLGIRDGKIHVYHDGIRDGIVADLLREGVQEKEIVIEWHPPHRRDLTPFAVA